jgi:cytochrome c oxidase cbb3-type subunit 2
VALLSIACILFNSSAGWAGLAQMSYIAGVSLYSTVLIFWPARGGRPWQAATLFAVAGWGGSALGIIVGKNHDHVPLWMVVSAAVAVAVSLVFRQRALDADRDGCLPRAADQPPSRPERFPARLSHPWTGQWPCPILRRPV